MKTFETWLKETHPEFELEEGIGKWLSPMALAASTLLPGNYAHATTPQAPPARSWNVSADNIYSGTERVGLAGRQLPQGSVYVNAQTDIKTSYSKFEKQLLGRHTYQDLIIEIIKVSKPIQDINGPNGPTVIRQLGRETFDLVISVSGAVQAQSADEVKSKIRRIIAMKLEQIGFNVTVGSDNDVRLTDEKGNIIKSFRGLRDKDWSRGQRGSDLPIDLDVESHQGFFGNFEYTFRCN